MKPFEWNEDKNELLKTTRNVSFEDVILSIQSGKILDIVPHFNPSKYPNQKLFIITILDYTYYVPFVEDEEKVFLKNIIPSRKYHKLYRS
ncbi:toxin [Sulfurovum riftiae]|uniref:Toxin n=1 Tax=Sulfurovum riftiae TaxID=1630136 RepID=A0A151CFX0_9BACT|nr:toxin [Sulfurovum riftiae]